MNTSLQIKIVTLLGYIIVSTALVVWADNGAPTAQFSVAAQR